MNKENMQSLLNKKVEFTYDEGNGQSKIILTVTKILDDMVYGLEERKNKKLKPLPFTLEYNCIIEYKEV